MLLQTAGLRNHTARIGFDRVCHNRFVTDDGRGVFYRLIIKVTVIPVITLFYKSFIGNVHGIIVSVSITRIFSVVRLYHADYGKDILSDPKLHARHIGRTEQGPCHIVIEHDGIRIISAQIIAGKKRDRMDHKEISAHRIDLCRHGIVVFSKLRLRDPGVSINKGTPGLIGINVIILAQTAHDRIPDLLDISRSLVFRLRVEYADLGILRILALIAFCRKLIIKKERALLLYKADPQGKQYHEYSDKQRYKLFYP